MAFDVNSSNSTIMGVQYYFQYFDCFKYVLCLSCETVNAASSGKLDCDRGAGVTGGERLPGKRRDPREQGREAKGASEQEPSGKPDSNRSRNSSSVTYKVILPQRRTLVT